jgi:hypothetical protein
MPAVYGARMTTFEDSEKESEYGYVRKVSQSLTLIFIHRRTLNFHLFFHRFFFFCLISAFVYDL